MFAALVALTLVAPPGEKEKGLPEAAKKELKKLEGRWELTQHVDAVKESKPDGREPKLHLVFKGGKMTLEFGEKKETVKVTAVDGGTDPKCIDLLEKRAGRPDRTVEGVYEVKGDTLRLAIHEPKDTPQRPTGFDKPTDPRTVVWTLTRVKE